MNKIIIIAFSLLFMSCQQNIDLNLKVYGIEDFFDNVSISGGYFSTDEEKIIFLTFSSIIARRRFIEPRTLFSEYF